MKRHATILTSLFLCLFFAVGPVAAQQEVTVREINDIPQNVVDSLQQVGADLDLAALSESGVLFDTSLVGDMVTFTAVILSDPYDSGLASVDDDGLPGRIHVFARDTMATELGLAGMGIQLVDGNYQNTGLINFLPGDVVTLTGTVAPFGITMQLTPESIEFVGTAEGLGLPDSLLTPVSITTADINRQLPGGGVQVNWSNLENVRGQYVRLETAVVAERNISNISRPNWAVSTDGGETAMSIYDTGIRYRNDRADYPDNFNKHPDDEFIPPPIGSTINLEGYVTFDDFPPFGFSVPPGAALKINPMAASDLEVVATPPVISDLSSPSDVPGDEPVEITAVVQADEGRTVSRLQLKYFSSTAPEDTLAVDFTSETSDEYTFEIPTQEDGAFVTYFVEAEDNTGAIAESSDGVYRVLFDGIDSIEDIQLTASGGFGDSPFAGDTLEMDLTVLVQSRLDTSGIISIQDDASQAPWTGIFVDGSQEALFTDWDRGDSVRITMATVEEIFDVTHLTNVTYEVLGEGEPIPYKDISTTALQDGNIAEAHEGMLLVFNSVTITEPDAGFGEWSFTTGAADESVKADDVSDAIEESFAVDNFNEGTSVAFIQGPWFFSFSEYKLLPEDPQADFGTISAIDDGSTLPAKITLDQNYPNPFTGTTTIVFQLNQPADVQLEVYDLLGRSIRTLVNDTKAAGSYTVKFEAGTLPSGVYFYRLQAGETVVTKKMLHLK